MLEIVSRDGLDLNLVSFFKDRFDVAWRAASPIGWAYAWWWTKKHSQWLAAGILLLVTFLTRHVPVALAIFGSMAATQIVNAAFASWDAIWALFRGRR
jgi:hypothetical protein